jgi:hypothetical protein
MLTEHRPVIVLQVSREPVEQATRPARHDIDGIEEGHREIVDAILIEIA